MVVVLISTVATMIHSAQDLRFFQLVLVTDKNDSDVSNNEKRTTRRLLWRMPSRALKEPRQILRSYGDATRTRE